MDKQYVTYVSRQQQSLWRYHGWIPKGSGYVWAFCAVYAMAWMGFYVLCLYCLGHRHRFYDVIMYVFYERRARNWGLGLAIIDKKEGRGNTAP